MPTHLRGCSILKTKMRNTFFFSVRTKDNFIENIVIWTEFQKTFLIFSNLQSHGIISKPENWHWYNYRALDVNFFKHLFMWLCPCVVLCSVSHVPECHCIGAQNYHIITKKLLCCFLQLYHPHTPPLTNPWPPLICSLSIYSTIILKCNGIIEYVNFI